MLTRESREILVNVLRTVGDTEIRTENRRKQIYSQRNSDFLRLFRVIDHLSVGFITSESLNHYLTQHEVSISVPEQLQLFSLFDRNSDGKVNYQDFSSFLTPKTSTTPKISSEISDTELDFYAFFSLLISEIDGIKQTFKLGSELLKKVDYSQSRAFYAISKGKKDVGNVVLRRFLDTNAENSSSDEVINAIIDRLDWDADGRIGQSDFYKFMQNITNSIAENERKASSPLNNIRVKPNKISILQESSEKTEEKWGFGPENHLDLEEKYLISILNLLNNVEILRQNLALSAESSLKSLFSLFFLENCEFLTYSALENSLRYLKIDFESNSVCLLMRHFDSDHDGKLSKSDFSQLILPMTPEYAQLYCLQQRNMRNFDASDRGNEEKVKMLLEEFLRFETGLENIREEISSNLDVFRLFQNLDKDKNGILTLNDFREFFASKKVFPPLFGLMALLQLFDENRDGNVHYLEFQQEVTPKLPSSTSLFSDKSETLEKVTSDFLQ